MELRVFQSMWGMERLGPDGTELPLDEKVGRIASAGFSGAEVEFDDYELARETTRLLAERDLDWTAECFPETVDELSETIERVVEFGPERCSHINLQPNIRPGRVLECIPFILGWQRLADEAGMELLFETHRDRMTTDLLFTLQLIDAVPAMKLTADLSHYLVGREFRYPVDDENHALIGRILERSWAFHGRVASREQVQVQIGFPQNRIWLDLFLGWWEQGFRAWRAQAPPDASLVFTPELGPPEWYAMTGPDGLEMSDRWEEAVELKGLIEEVWARLEAQG